jgi:hypothetical protein
MINHVVHRPVLGEQLPVRITLFFALQLRLSLAHYFNHLCLCVCNDTFFFFYLECNLKRISACHKNQTLSQKFDKSAYLHSIPEVLPSENADKTNNTTSGTLNFLFI